ncbi:YhcB family protein [Chromatocurvus halotolerans]|uniref:Z-ring associated protein G n=1 Tax=Chromatocurvus halotolerans TaxID=1132028 RepID=A0A4R2L103_9GAMM|nr:DUF1043 family protein [Chromatocurvus halotolerans]TCO76218.1 uncharacterized membrane-anchored protein YhcB (DUF1043 family) [Chromatocurvus halotolerans]
MYSLDIVIGTAICVLIIAGAIGFLMGRRTTAGSQQARELEKRLDQVTRDKQLFEDRVTDHFAETATRLNALTENYRAVHEHLAEGANTLCSGNLAVTVGRLGGDSDLDASLLNAEPPRDYAPKSSPTEKGMLNEGFGLDKDDVAPAEKTSRVRHEEPVRAHVGATQQAAAVNDDARPDDEPTEEPTEEPEKEESPAASATSGAEATQTAGDVSSDEAAEKNAGDAPRN